MENTKPKALRLALDYYNAWNSHDFEKASSALADTIAFDTPLNAYANKTEFMKAVEFTALTATKSSLISTFGTDSEALLLYDLTLPMATVTIAEHFTVKQNRIIFIRHVHDTYEFRKIVPGNL